MILLSVRKSFTIFLVLSVDPSSTIINSQKIQFWLITDWIDSIIKLYVESDNKLKKQLDERIITSYILLSNVFPLDISKMIIKLCNFNDFIMDVPRDVYLFARIYYKNIEEKERMIELYKKNKQIKNLINNLHSKKYKK